MKGLVKDFFNQLPEGVRELAIQNTIDQGKCDIKKATAISLMSALAGAFSWGKTPEGEDYWRERYGEVVLGLSSQTVENANEELVNFAAQIKDSKPVEKIAIKNKKEIVVPETPKDIPIENMEYEVGTIIKRDKKTSEIISTYKTVKEASEANPGISNSSISCNVTGKSKSAGGFKWEKIR